MQLRLRRAFDQYLDLQDCDDLAIAQLLRQREVDIIIDLNGYTHGCRPAIFDYRPAPIQVSYLGYPGTIGTSSMDYIIADRIVVPSNLQGFFSEKVVYLPDCYQVNDSKRVIGQPPTRKEAGLPERGIVFCCFSQSWKISGTYFEVWMRLLKNADESVLWLINDNEEASSRLRLEARTRGVNQNRLIFSPKVAVGEHLARHRLADIALDTLPCNAHTTASDALQAGVPIVTCVGQSFPGRVAASLLHSVGVTELVTETIASYEAIALKLAKDPGYLMLLKEKIARGLQQGPLLDTDRFRQNLESAYKTMWAKAEQGECPEAFTVDH
jgi:predicted O-linked N-acetylglucosamine transferase (SPINDLY family)